jgi:DNA uptake protein ComE-like DNA-binding protein
MRLPVSKPSSKVRRQHAAVLIIVLWIAIGLISIALYFASSMTYELRASDNRASGLETQQAIEGAARYVSFALYNYSTNGAVPANTQFSCQAVPVGDAHFWIIGRDPSETSSSDPYFSLVDEGSKLNLNTVGTNTLEFLPNMTTDFADAIVDWRSTNGLGLYSMNYNALGYNDKNEPFETVEELRLVYGATMNLLEGNDLNLNGVLDGNEQGTGGNAEVQPGLFEYCTVYTREPNFNLEGVLLTNVNTATEEDLQTLMQVASVSTTYATRIYNYTHPRAGGTVTFNGMMDFCAYCKTTLGMSSDDFSKIYPYVTTSTATYISGRVNIDTASTTVLTALFAGVGYNEGVDQSTAESAAETILNYRQQNPDDLTSIAWIVDALGSSSPVIRALRLGDYITAHSYQFSADIAAVGPYGRGYRRVKFIFDTSNGTPIIIYRRDMSGLGWALGDKVRQTWVANATQ